MPDASSTKAKRRVSTKAADAIAPMSAAAQLRALRLEAMGQFAPLLAGAAVLSAMVVSTTLWRQVPHFLLASWLLVVIASAWLGMRRLQTNALTYLGREVPGRTGIENGAMLVLVAGLWVSLPMAVYAGQSSDLQTVIAATVCALMCGALAIAASPVSALAWAGTLTAGLAFGVVTGADHYWPAMAVSVALHFAFIGVVVRRIGQLSRVQADRLAAQHMETAAAQRLMREIEESGTSCLWQSDAANVLTYVTPGIAALLGRSLSQIVGTPLPALLGGNGALGAALLARTAFSGIEVDLGTGGGNRALAFAATPAFDEAGRFAGFRGTCADVTETRSSERRLRELSSVDTLTELPNRTRIRAVMEDAMVAARSGTEAGSVLMLDLDGFKSINETLGHPAGDAVLKAAAARMAETVGVAGVAGRLGGDEFAVLLRDTRNRRLTGDLIERLIAEVSRPYLVDGSTVRVGVSIGSADCEPDDTVDALIQRGDLALAAAKAAGGNVHRAFDDEMRRNASARRQLEHDLRRALELDQFVVYYQPLIHSQRQEVTGFEALVRWNHPSRGFVSPADFIPLAEETGVIHELGEWVARTAIRDCATWPAPITVAVNLSPIQLLSPRVPAIIADALGREELAASRLELEVTESVLIGDSEAGLDVLRRLRAQGVRIALDDFGTGYSSLGYLNRTIFNKLKIDGSFVRAAATRPETVSIIQAIVTLANCFQMTITAEGIETQDDFRRMAGLGCHQMQGYLFGRPAPYAQATELVGLARPHQRAAAG